VSEKKKTAKSASDRSTSTKRIETERLGKKYGLSTRLVRKVLQKEGPARRDLDKYLQKSAKK
jgi:hypothetical protein